MTELHIYYKEGRKMNRKTVHGIMLTILTIVIGLTGMMPVVSAPPPSLGLFNLEINHASSFWGIPMDSEWGTPAWHIRAAIAHLFDKEAFAIEIYPEAIVIDNKVPNVGPLSNWYLEWTPELLSAVDPWHTGAVSLYNNVPMEPDIYEARDHLIMSGGIGNDGLPWHDNDNDGRIDNPPTSQIYYYYNVGNVIREAVGNYLELWIEYVFNGADVMIVLGVSWSTFLEIIYNPPYDDWHLVSLGHETPRHPPPESLFAYHSPNLVFYNNSMYDYLVDHIPPPQNALKAQFVFGASIGAIPIWCTE